jgi:hypothetical protein
MLFAERKADSLQDKVIPNPNFFFPTMELS